MANADYFLKKTLGEDFEEALIKFELYKPGTRTVVDHEELRTALMIVPRVIMALLIRELAPMQVGENKKIDLPVAPNVVLNITKHERDVYSGDIDEDNKKIVDFKFRALPGVGLVIMSAFELYDLDNIINSSPPATAGSEDISAQIERIIEERLSLHHLIGKVVDQKIMEKEAINQLILNKLSSALAPQPIEAPKPIEVITMPKEIKKGSPLSGFLKKRETKKKPQEFSIQMAKGEVVDCPDCGKNIFDGAAFSGCICLGDDMDRKVFIKKTEDGIKVRFSKGWDIDNVELLLEVLRRKNNG